MLTGDLTRRMTVGHRVTFARGAPIITRFDAPGGRPHLYYDDDRGRELHLDFPPDLPVVKGDGTLTIRDPELGTVIIGPAPQK